MAQSRPERRPSLLDAISRWLPVTLWATVISLFSTERFVARQTGRWLMPLLRWLLPHAAPVTLRALHAAVRKLAHVTEYAILAVLLWRALDSERRSSRLTALATLLACASYAALDEWHQTFVPGRVGSSTDAMIDTLGAALGLAARLAIMGAISFARRSRA